MAHLCAFQSVTLTLAASNRKQYTSDEPSWKMSGSGRACLRKIASGRRAFGLGPGPNPSLQYTHSSPLPLGFLLLLPLRPGRVAGRGGDRGCHRASRGSRNGERMEAQKSVFFEKKTQ